MPDEDTKVEKVDSSPHWHNKGCSNDSSVQVDNTHVSAIATGATNSDQRVGPVIRMLNGDIVLMPHWRPDLSHSITYLWHKMSDKT